MVDIMLFTHSIHAFVVTMMVSHAKNLLCLEYLNIGNHSFFLLVPTNWQVVKTLQYQIGR